VPVGARETCEQLRSEADDVVCAEMPGDFRAVGLAYQDFAQAGDEEVRTLLASARLHAAAPAH
jgi:putative phosphoribosyl transferase